MLNALIQEGDIICINVPYFEAYIPDELFGDPSKAATVACEYADGIKSIGIFNIRIFESEEQSRDDVDIRIFNYPNIIETYPSEYSTEVITINGVAQKMKVLKYYKGDIMMNASSKKGSENCEFFLNLLLSGKVPKGIKPEDVFLTWVKNFQINAVNPGVPYLTLQMIISEMYRYSKDPVKQYRKIAGLGNSDNNNDYMAANMNQVSSYSSVMSALTFERFSDKLATSITMSKSGVKQNRSPIEQVLSM